MKIRSIFSSLLALSLFPVPLSAEEEPTMVLIKNVSVWDGRADAAVAADVLIENNLVKEVGKGISA